MPAPPPSRHRSPASAPAPRRSVATACVHGPGRAKRAFDALPTPIVATATYAFSSTAELRDHFEGRIEREEYGRYGNPTVRSAERALAAVERAEDAALFSSGMAAISTALLATLKSGDHVVLTRDVYRRTRQLVTTTLAKFGVESTVVEPTAEAVREALVPGKTRVVFTELPTNPYLRVVDLDALALVAKSQRGVKLFVDATFATPVNLRPLEHGADLVVHSCTKYLAGHNDVLAGSIAGSAALVGAIRESRGVFGAILDPHAAFLLERGLKTLALRVERQNRTAARVAAFLHRHPAVREVFHPSLPSHPDHAIACRLLSGFGGVVTFRVKGTLDETSAFVDACRLATIAPSLGGVETLIEQPALMSYYELTSEERLAIGVPDDLVRLAIGIEDEDDILRDLEQALGVVPAATSVVGEVA
jgi:cystathionine gamma-synthase